ncbi:hypothetical protein F4679DRAFT_596165 [Xylaria curta]|nr:hypothetical protein F4679DRAFT_596165 [Xylaria curta]
MDDSTLTPFRREGGWNVHFTIDPENRTNVLGGIYQVPGSDLVTFRDVRDELRLSFEFPNMSGKNHSDDPWTSIAFALTGSPDLTNLPNLREELQNLSFISGDLLAKPVPSLSPTRFNQQQLLTYCVVSHRNCTLSAGTALDIHLKEKCARRLSKPCHRFDPRYLPVNDHSSDTAIATPLRPAEYTPSNPTPSDSTSPNWWDSDDDDDDDDDDDYTQLQSMPASASMRINIETYNSWQSKFRSKCIDSQLPCAVSGQGCTWWGGVGPAIEACQIVPLPHYHRYLLGDMNIPTEEEISAEAAKRRYRMHAKVWPKAWSPENGILLRKDLHELFDARLFSIHPKTFVIRVFVPYDILTGFNGKEATLPRGIDTEALRHHYEICCIENMSPRTSLRYIFK